MKLSLRLERAIIPLMPKKFKDAWARGFKMRPQVASKNAVIRAQHPVPEWFKRPVKEGIYSADFRIAYDSVHEVGIANSRNNN